MNRKTFWIGSVLHKQIFASNSLFLYLSLKSQYFPLSLPFTCSLPKVERTWKVQSTRLAFLLVCLTRNWLSHHSGCPPFMQLSRGYGSAVEIHVPNFIYISTLGTEVPCLKAHEKPCSHYYYITGISKSG